MDQPLDNLKGRVYNIYSSRNGNVIDTFTVEDITGVPALLSLRSEDTGGFIVQETVFRQWQMNGLLEEVDGA